MVAAMCVGNTRSAKQRKGRRWKGNRRYHWCYLIPPTPTRSKTESRRVRLRRCKLLPIYRLRANRSYGTGVTSQTEQRPNPTEEQIHAWLSEMRNAFVGHMGFHHQTMKRLQRRKHTWVKKMGADIVSRFIKECPYCQKYDQRDNHEVSFRVVPSIHPNETTVYRYHWRVTGDGTRVWIQVRTLVVLDTFSRWVELYPLRSKGAIEAIWRTRGVTII
jgi:hypothetical protein